MNHQVQIVIIGLCLILISCILCFSAQADVLSDIQKDEGANICDIFVLLRNIKDIAFATIGALAVIMIIYAGFVLATSGGDTKRLSKGKDILKYAIIGIVVAALAWVIITAIFVSIGYIPEGGNWWDVQCVTTANN